jgi:DNA-binding response OmpR family regulator
MAKILVVDDDPDVVEATRLFLERQGYAVACAYSRQEGMKAIAAETPDLVILDVMMEQHDDGFTMAQQLRREGFRKPILMLTSIGKVTGLAYGIDKEMVPVDAFQEKPVDPQVLLAKVRQLLAESAGKGGGGSCC